MVFNLSSYNPDILARIAEILGLLLRRGVEVLQLEVELEGTVRIFEIKLGPCVTNLDVKTWLSIS